VRNGAVHNPSQIKAIRVSPARAPLRGRIRLPGDKSLSIRRALLTLFTEQEVELENYGSGEDCLTALYCLERLGKRVLREGSRVTIQGAFDSRSAMLDCRNSGTCARLLMGILAGREGEWEIAGDDSLSLRPMERVATPLRCMGAQIELSNGRLPATIKGGRLFPISFESHVASAQVKSAVLLAGLSGSVEVHYHEPFPSRAHTERLLGVEGDEKGWLHFRPAASELNSEGLCGSIPGDPSSAAFWGVAATVIPASRIALEGVLLDDIRCGWVNVLRDCGANILYENEASNHDESIGDIVCSASILSPLSLSMDLIPRVIDEVPILSVAASQANGESKMEGLGELRVKESDRLTCIYDGLTGMRADIQVLNDSLTLRGPVKLKGANIQPHGDHRIAMAFAVAGLIADGSTKIIDSDCVTVSYPEFWQDFVKLSPGSIIDET
jgi:3-phosphoshikimate 1-carboxyvinyltransferase